MKNKKISFLQNFKIHFSYFVNVDCRRLKLTPQTFSQLTSTILLFSTWSTSVDPRRRPFYRPFHPALSKLKLKHVYICVLKPFVSRSCFCWIAWYLCTVSWSMEHNPMKDTFQHFKTWLSVGLVKLTKFKVCLFICSIFVICF